VSILPADLSGDHDRLLKPRGGGVRRIMVDDLPDGHHAFDHAAVLDAVNALRWRFDRAFRVAFGH
jgi:hypothetical protein